MSTSAVIVGGVVKALVATSAFLLANWIIVVLAVFMAGVIFGLASKSEYLLKFELRLKLRYMILSKEAMFLLKNRQAVNEGIKEYPFMVKNILSILSHNDLHPSEDVDFKCSRLIDSFWRGEISASLQKDEIVFEHADGSISKINIRKAYNYGYPTVYKDARTISICNADCVSVDVRLDTAKLTEYLETRFPRREQHWYVSNTPKIVIN